MCDGWRLIEWNDDKVLVDSAGLRVVGAGNMDTHLIEESKLQNVT